MIKKIASNKFLISGIAFAVWMLFFDEQDLISTHIHQRSELNKLKKSRDHFIKEIELTREELRQLETDPALLEKYAREKYRMKRDNEDVFIIP